VRDRFKGVCGVLIALAGCVAVLAVGAANADATTYYQATPVDTGVDVWGLYLNPNGWTLGTSDGSGSGAPWSVLVEDGHGRVVVTPCGNVDCSTNATAVNLSGQVSGFVVDPSVSAERAFLFDSTTGVTTMLRPNSEAYAINGVGQLVGGYQNVSGHERAFLWDGSTFKDLGTLGGKQAVATATPQQNEAVGCAQTKAGAWHPFLYKNGIMKDLGLPPGFTQGCAYSANQKGQIVGGDKVFGLGWASPMAAQACKSWSRSASGKYTRIVASPARTCVRATHVDADGVVALSANGAASTWKAGTGLTPIRPANVPFGDDLLQDGLSPTVYTDSLGGSNAHGQLLVHVHDEPNDDSLSELLTPLKIYDENNTALTYAGAWLRGPVAGAWGGSVDVALSPGATLTLPFTGRTVSVIAPTGPGFGSATITIDGANPTTVTENAASATRQRVFEATFPSAGAHSLTIVAGIGFQVDAVTTTQN
jgi:probable HAF family extracellular repeat protein